MTKPNLTIVIKGATATGINLPGLERLITAGRTQDGIQAASNDALLFQLFQLEPSPDRDLPVAAVTRLLDLGIVDKGWWLRADPVHLVPGRRGLLMAANRQLDISEEEASALVREISADLLEEGWVLKAPNPHRWYLKPASPPAIQTYPVDQVLGQDIEDFLPHGPDAKAWHTRLNEIQILLHTSSINADRESRGKLPINSVWFWGGGSLPAVTETSWKCLWSDDVVSQALARLTETESRILPANYKEWSTQAEPGNHLVVFNQQEKADWASSFDGNWAVPMVDALKQKNLGALTLYIGNTIRAIVTADSLKPKWRWRLPFMKK